MLVLRLKWKRFGIRHGRIRCGRACRFEDSMVEARTHRRLSRNRKKRTVPLSKLRTSEVVRTVVDHPRRLEELLNMLDDKDRLVRGRAAATLARLSESYPGRLLRIVERLQEGLSDDSAYVRWHLVYALGCVGASFPRRASGFLSELSSRLDDENRIVRVLATKAMGHLADRRPKMIRDLFEASRRTIPSTVARILRRAGCLPKKP